MLTVYKLLLLKMVVKLADTYPVLCKNA